MVDFGHAKQIFEDADVFPCIIVVEKPTEVKKPETAMLCTIPREQLRIDDLSLQIEQEGVPIDSGHLGSETWQLESTAVTDLFARLLKTGTPLAKFIGQAPIYGLKTGCNAAFFVSDEQKKRLIKEDPNCSTLFVRYFRGQDVKRWHSEWDGEWLIALRSSAEQDWPWSKSENAEVEFAAAYPSISEHMAAHRAALLARKNSVRFWWELSPFSAWENFKETKIIYQEIQFHPAYALETDGVFSNNKTFILPTEDLYLLAVLNSPLAWWFNWRHLPHMKDEALTPAAFLIAEVPIAEPTSAVRTSAEIAVRRLIDLTATQQKTKLTILDWLRLEYAIEKPTNKLQNLTALDSDSFVAEVRKIRGKKLPLTAAGLQALREEHTRTIDPARALAAEAQKLERELSDLVNQAYNLTPEEIALMWATAPPRMPIPKPLTNS